jgi:hypothetical protein
MENTKTTLTNLDTGIEAIVERDGDDYKLTIRDTDTDKPYTHIRHKDRNVLLQKAWQAISVLVLLALSACGDNPCGCPFGTVCQPMPSRHEGFVCVAPPQASDAR